MKFPSTDETEKARVTEVRLDDAFNLTKIIYG